MQDRLRLIPKRKRLFPGAYKPDPGSAPGILTVNPSSYPTQVSAIGYGPEGFVELAVDDVESLNHLTPAWPVLWISVIGLANLEVVEQIGAMFGLERLLLEDVLDTSHRPKVEYYEHYVFTILKGGALADQFETEHLAIFLKKNVVIVFEEKPGSSFNQVRERIRRGTGRIRHQGTDYLYYALLDEVIDKYFPILDRLNVHLSNIEEEIMTGNQTHGDKGTIQNIHHAKSDLLLLHKTVWPVSDIISMIMREETPLITKATRGFLRDCYDHGIQANELTQFYRDTASGLLNTYLAYEGHKTNEIVKVLTMISAVFIPLNFVAGVYGMNFHPDSSPFNMPELEWYFGYPFAWGVMIAIAAGMVVFFRKRGWLRRQ